MTTPETAPPADPTTYRRRGLGLGSWTAIVLALLVIGAVLGVQAGKLFDTPENAEIVHSIIPSFTSPPPAATTAAAVGSEDGGDAAPTEDSANLTSLAARIERLESNQARTLEAASSALAAANLLDAAQSARPFTGELAAVEPFLPQADLTALRPFARTGVATRTILADDYAAAAARAIATANMPAQDAGPMDRIRYALSSVVTIRRVDYTQGQGPNAVLARAELLVHDGDLEGALEELEALPPGAHKAMEAWSARAAQRVALDHNLATLRATSLRTLNAALADAS